MENLETGKLSQTETAGETVRSFSQLSVELPKKLAVCGATLRTAVQRQFRLRCVTNDGVLNALYTAFFELQEVDLQLTLSHARRDELEARLREVLEAVGLMGQHEPEIESVGKSHKLTGSAKRRGKTVSPSEAQPHT